ncbi:uncharacterized protein [Onthophagus taurus]|uniref:uncharacterized protein isoform X2 n=1 Tax=Onthophagus taurus TaxID=166361 RepID=UPI0039BE74BF
MKSILMLLVVVCVASAATHHRNKKHHFKRDGGSYDTCVIGDGCYEGCTISYPSCPNPNNKRSNDDSGYYNYCDCECDDTTQTSYQDDTTTTPIPDDVTVKRAKHHPAKKHHHAKKHNQHETKIHN